MSDTATTDEVIVSRAWLADHLEAVRVVDVREAWEYEGIGHVPGAVNVPFDTFRSEDGDAGMLPGADAFGELLGSKGIAPGDTVVAYDDTHGVFAARFVVTALLYGFGDVHLLDGDYSAWNREYETTTAVPDPDPVAYELDPPDDEILISRADVEAAIGGDAVLVDTREPWEYEEGHLPGAVNLDWKELVDEDTRGLKPREDLERILSSYGITPDRWIVLYCNTARRISHTYLVLEHLGYPHVDFYEGSLTEWNAVGGELETGR